MVKLLPSMCEGLDLVLNATESQREQKVSEHPGLLYSGVCGYGSQ